jgi:hypothetical protein
MEGLESMRRAAVKIGFGTDLLGKTYLQQCREFTLRKQVSLRSRSSTFAAYHAGR